MGCFPSKSKSNKKNIKVITSIQYGLNVLTVSVICCVTISCVCLRKYKDSHSHLFHPWYHRAWYITNWFNLSRDLNNAIVPFVRINVPTGPAWSINVRWTVAFITVLLSIPYRGVNEDGRADVWEPSFDAWFHRVCMSAVDVVCLCVCVCVSRCLILMSTLIIFFLFCFVRLALTA